MQIAQAFTRRQELVPDDQAAVAKVTRLRAGLADRAGTTVEERVIDVGVILRRMIDGIPADGPGGHIMVYIGNEGEVTGVDRIWRPITGVHSEVQPLHPREWLAGRVSRHLGADGMARLDIQEIRLGYFLTPAPGDTSEIEARMRPGRLSRLGFPGPDERLADVLARDEATMRGLGLSHAHVAGVLADLIGRAEGSPGRRVTVDHRFDVSVTVYKGFQICPWAADPHRGQCDAAGGPRFASLDWTIRNLRTGRQEHGPGLLEHLVGAHHFFAGEQSPYRVAPDGFAGLWPGFRAHGVNDTDPTDHAIGAAPAGCLYSRRAPGRRRPRHVVARPR